MSSNFIHLRVHSSYSLSEGAIKIDELIDLCKKHKMPAVAITDSGNLFGALEFSQACMKNGIQPIIGCIVNIRESENTRKLVLLAKNEKGFGNLLKLVSKSYLDGDDCHNPTITLSDLKDFSSGLIALTNEKNEATFIKLKTLFPDCLYVELSRHSPVIDRESEKQLIDLAYKYDIPLVATNDVMFATIDMYEAHDALICIAKGRYVAEKNRPKFTNEYYFKSPREMEKLFSDIPEAIANTAVIAKRCAVMPESHAPMLPHFPTENGRSEEDELRAIAEKGLENHLADVEDKKPYIDRLNYELDVINKMEFPGYFLIVSDFIRWSKENDIPVGPGRGSGAGSVVAWALQITDLDPLQFGLLFERFLNPERISMPDFDIDFCQERRDEVIKYVCQKYGADKVAQIITFGKLQARAVLRDVGRVLQIPYGNVDKICKMIPFNPINPVTLSKAIDLDPKLRKEAKQDDQIKKLLDIGLKLEGLHRHASTHAAGVVILPKSIDEMIPLYTDHKSDIPTTQYSMKYVEMAGAVKFDFLGLKTLTVISHACKLINKTTSNFDIRKIPFDDPATFAMLTRGATTGVFQMESAGMRDALRKMKPDSIEDIIALISLYRPGPMENIPTYIARKHGKEKPDYLHPKLEDCLKETFGVIIYQEQVMKVAQLLAGYSLGSADLLRRAMGKKIASEMDAQRDMFVKGSIANGVDEKQAGSIFDLVAKFAGYGFNKSHAAAYAVIGYQTAYLKANFPVEFLTASMNIDIGDTDKLNVFIDSAVTEDIKILLPDINKSDAHFTVEKLPEEELTNGIRYGLGALKNVGLAAMEEMVKERNNNGVFKSAVDFAERCDNKVVNKRLVESLAKSGSFDSIEHNRKKLFEGAGILVRCSHTAAEERASSQTNLFDKVEEQISALPDVDDWNDEKKLLQEFEAIGFFLSAHPLDNYIDDLKRAGVISAIDLQEKVSSLGGKIKIAGIARKVAHRTSAKGGRFTYLYISDHTGSIEVQIFDDKLISDSREILETKKPLMIRAEAKKDEGGIRLQAETISSLDEFLENTKYTLKLFLEKTDALQAIKNILNTNGENKTGKAKVLCYIVTPQKMEVEIALNETFMLNKNTINTLSSIKGVKAVAE